MIYQVLKISFDKLCVDWIEAEMDAERWRRMNEQERQVQFKTLQNPRNYLASQHQQGGQ